MNAMEDLVGRNGKRSLDHPRGTGLQMIFRRRVTATWPPRLVFPPRVVLCAFMELTRRRMTASHRTHISSKPYPNPRRFGPWTQARGSAHVAIAVTARCPRFHRLSPGGSGRILRSSLSGQGAKHLADLTTQPCGRPKSGRLAVPVGLRAPRVESPSSSTRSTGWRTTTGWCGGMGPENRIVGRG